MPPLLFRLGCLIVFVALCACRPSASPPAKPLPQRAYVWQRVWTSAVADAVREGLPRFDGLVLLGAEIVWVAPENKAKVIRANIAWPVIAQQPKPISLALRIAPFSGPFVADDERTRFILAEARALLETATAHGVECKELQIDFDCAQRRLAGYSVWLRALRAGLPTKTRLVITSLPSWLGEAELPKLLALVDGYVLQVHSVPTLAETGRVALCDAAQARRWVAKAIALGRPFEIALPTYRCLAGYDAQEGSSLGLALDGPQPDWPRGTRVVEYVSEATQIAALVHEWQSQASPLLRGLLWYRLPVSTDVRNWRWPTLSAVMAGREPVAKLVPQAKGDALVDITLLNEGETDDRMANIALDVAWGDAALLAAEALPGWKLEAHEGRATFTCIAAKAPRLPPGSSVAVGWLRFEKPTTLKPALRESALAE